MAWNRPNEVGRVAPRPPNARGAARHAVIMALLVGILAVAACLLLPRNRAETVAHAKNPKATCSAANRVHVSRQVESRKNEFDADRAASARSDVKVPAQSAEDAARQEKELDREAEDEVTGRKDLRKINAADQMILTLLNADQNAEQAPMPENAVSEEEFDRALKTKIALRENDSSEVRKLKEILIAARAEISALRKEGLTVNEILARHREDFNANIRLRADAAAIAQEIYDSGDVEGSVEYVKMANGLLEDKGAGKIEAPLSAQEEAVVEKTLEADEQAERERLAEERADIERRKAEYKESKMKERR